MLAVRLGQKWAESLVDSLDDLKVVGLADLSVDRRAVLTAVQMVLKSVEKSVACWVEPMVAWMAAS